MHVAIAAVNTELQVLYTAVCGRAKKQRQMSMLLPTFDFIGIEFY